ncbi:MAG: hypothetical protein ACSHX9_16430 [Luteolibacter sp.]
MSKFTLIVSLALGLASLMAGLHCLFRLEPNIEVFDSRALEAMAAENYVASNESMSQVSTLSQELKRYAILTLTTGLLGAALALPSGLKKNPFGWVALALSLIGLALGISQLS